MWQKHSLLEVSTSGCLVELLALPILMVGLSVHLLVGEAKKRAIDVENWGGV